MIELIDNLGYSGKLPNFARDNMAWEDMQQQTTETLDLGHIVFCISPENKGHWVFLGELGWKKLINEDGSIVASINTYDLEITDGDIKTVTINKEIHKCGNYPDISVIYLGEKVYPDIEMQNGDVTISWGKVNISESTPLLIKLTGK